MIGHRSRKGHRAFGLRGRNALIQCALGQPVISVRETHQGPGKHRENEGVDSGATRRHHARHISIRNEHVLQESVVAASRAHSEDIPGFLDDVAHTVTWHERMHNLWLVRVAGVHPMQAKTSPDGSEASKVLVPREAIASSYTFGFCGGEKHRNVV